MELLRVKGLKKYFPVKGSIFGSKGNIRAVDGVSFCIKPNRVFALVGESGCGKSTVARLILRLMPVTEGVIVFKGNDITSLEGKALLPFRRAVQIIFQDPFASLNPRMKVLDILSEPLVVHKLCRSKTERVERVVELLNKVGLSSEVLNRYPHEFSGGQRQRVCIARALALSPELIIADEPLSALDVSLQAQIINLFQILRKEYSLSLLLISHDLNVVRYLSDEVAVMYLGRILEHGHTNTIYNTPLHPYTELLLSVVPKIGKEPMDMLLTGEAPGPLDTPTGCLFHTRCPKAFGPCKDIAPELKKHQGRDVACHLYG
jgi:oligopeptide/dipeptide ABC transporter ATP-binding protein